jgi:hypothetical protein
LPLRTPDFVTGQQGFVIGGRHLYSVRPSRDMRLYATKAAVIFARLIPPGDKAGAR